MNTPNANKPCCEVKRFPNYPQSPIAAAQAQRSHWTSGPGIVEHRFELRRGTDLLSKCFHFTGVGIAVPCSDVTIVKMFSVPTATLPHTCPVSSLITLAIMDSFIIQYVFWQIFIHFAHVLPGFPKICPDRGRCLKTEPPVVAVQVQCTGSWMWGV